jgi:hypothetical protein
MRGKEQIRGRKRQREKGLGRERDNDGRERERKQCGWILTVGLNQPLGICLTNT